MTDGLALKPRHNDPVDCSYAASVYRTVHDDEIGYIDRAEIDVNGRPRQGSHNEKGEATAMVRLMAANGRPGEALLDRAPRKHRERRWNMGVVDGKSIVSYDWPQYDP